MERGLEQGRKQGLEQGLEQGRRDGELKVLLRMLTNALGPLPSDIELQLRELTEPQLEQLSDRIPTLTSLDTLTGYLSELKR